MQIVIIRSCFCDMYVIHSLSGERHESTDDNFKQAPREQYSENSKMTTANSYYTLAFDEMYRSHVREKLCIGRKTRIYR